ncbi:site-specific integrase [Azohydromonas lata]|uniref:Uncharacterized protein n=1 Tax=Azohydromonas lata TaxID=45677 RepID=A0ABU5I9Q6_9BURK|nr:hypothetical protein [Azohydromonas lata]MDZ5455834.1 hypothetical protein [Azohydromonas lata]
MAITTGPVLRCVGTGDRVSTDALSDRSVAAIVKDYAARGLRHTDLQQPLAARWVPHQRGGGRRWRAQAHGGVASP